MAGPPTFKLPLIRAATSFRRPHDLLYASNERLPALAWAGLTFQHVATALALIAYVLAAARLGNLDTADTQAMLTATIIGMGVATFLQSWGGRLGPGLLIVHIPDPLLVVLIGLVGAHYGLGGVMVIGLLNGLVALFAGYLVPRLRTVLPPTVAGVVICVAGLSLIKPALQHATGLTDGQVESDATIASSITLAVIVAISIWGGRRAKLFALLAGLLCGVVSAALLGQIHGAAQLTHAPMFGVPSASAPVLGIEAGILGAIALLSLMTQLDTFGSAVLVHKMNDADWRRPDMRLASGAMRANGLGSIAGALLGGYPVATSSANIALTHISRSTSRWIGLSTGLALVTVAFMPMASLALTLIPDAVIGAIELYAAAYLIVSGVELIASRALDARGIFMVGISFIAGIGVMSLPELAALAPASVQVVVGNAIIVAGLTAIALNLLFRLGSSQRHEQPIASNGEPLAEQVLRFVETHGAEWNARRDVLRRAAQASVEAAEALTAHGRTVTQLHGRFDEFNLDIELKHSGPPLTMEPVNAATAPDDMLELDDAAFGAALDAAMEAASQRLLQRLADRVHTIDRNGTAALRLHFDH